MVEFKIQNNESKGIAVVDVAEVAENIYMIDNNLFSIPRWGSVYLLNETKKALVETGPTTSSAAVLEGIKQLGISPADLDYVIVTHIHLDHAGGAGTLLQHMPKAKLLVHPRGAKHMIDPSRLVASAEATRGSEVMEMHGEVVPVDADRVRPVTEGDTLDLSDRQVLTFMDTPGHAPHHLCITESRNHGVFTGDALALYVPEQDVLLPYHPPIQFDLELCLQTLDRLKKLSASCVYYSHFGVSRQVDEHIERARDKLMVWDGIALKAAGNGTFDKVKDELVAAAMTEVEPMKGVPSLEKLYDYLVHKSFPMNAEGHIVYYRNIYFH